ncbi:hypothetical protein [Mesorhizobium sp. A623]
MSRISISKSASGGLSVSMPIPENIGKQFDARLLSRSGVQIDGGCATFGFTSSGNGNISLDRQFRVDSYPGRFETDMASYHLADIKKEFESSASHIVGKQSGQETEDPMNANKSSAAAATNAPPEEAPSEGPTRRQDDDETIEAFPDGTKEMKDMRRQPAKPEPKPKPPSAPEPIIPPPPKAPKPYIPPPPRIPDAPRMK